VVQGEQSEAVLAKKHELEYFSSAIQFMKILSDSMDPVCHFLGSNTPTDVSEAINFITIASEFGLSAAAVGIRKMLLLIFSKDSSIRESVISAFERIYLQGADKGIAKKEQGAQIARQLTQLVKGATVAELISIEECAMEVQKQGLMKTDVREALWKMLSSTGETDLEDAQAASKLLCFMAKGAPKMLRDKTDLMLAAACGPSSWKDPVIARYMIMACLQAKAILETRQLNELVTEVVALASQPWCLGSQWASVLEQIIQLVFCSSQEPLGVLSGLVKGLHNATLQVIESDKTDDIGEHLVKLFFVVGDVALEMLVYAEDYDRRVKRHRHEQEKSKVERKEEAAGDSLSEELGMSEADELHEAEMLQQICEGKIVGPGSLLGDFEGLLVAVCSSDESSCDLQTRTAAIMALCKCMSISTSFCEKHLRLLFSILQSSKSARIRAMVIVALGDMAFRFPNLLEPWNEKMYARLADPEAPVRKNTLLVMSHLILNDMIKAKGHIAHVAICLEDEDPKIQELSRLFWSEFSGKQNAIYNVIPDVISSLAADESVDEDAFRRIMKLLMSYIEKDKQSESLIEKLCHRIRDSKDQSIGKDLVYCLAQLNFNTKCVRKLIDNFKCWHTLLHDEAAMLHMETICSKCRRFAKDDMKTALDELEAKMRPGKSGNADEDGTKVSESAEKPEAKSVLKPSKKVNKATKKGKGRGKAKDSDGESDDGDDDCDEVIQKAAPTRRSRRSVQA